MNQRSRSNSTRGGGNRRRSRRIPVRWAARYLIENGEADAWHDCRILDVSIAGASLEVFGPAPVRGGALLVDLRLVTKGSVELFLDAQVRFVDTAHPVARVGIQWTPMTANEREGLAFMLALHAELDTGS